MKRTVPFSASPTNAERKPAGHASPGRLFVPVIFRLLAILPSLLLWSLAAQAQGDPERGRAKAEPCAGCHGESGTSELEMTPSLAGQPETYLFNQLFLFREGLRRVEAMTQAVQGMSDDDLQDLAAHFAGQTLSAKVEPPEPAKQERGAALSQQYRCGSCHLPNYAGRVQMPRLAGQREDYLLHAMRQYRDNQRAGIDTSMAAVLYGVSDDDLAVLAHYLARHD